MTAVHIECRDLVRIFAAERVEVQALQGLNLTIEKGELTAVVGASGSGKSTLLNILSGLDVPTAGAASVAGRDLVAMTTRDRLDYRRHVVGFVWQQTSRNLLPYLTAAENIALALSVAGAPRSGRSARIEELLGLMGIPGMRDRRPGQLSGGEQQRVAIAVALANAPDTLLADEPTGELDEDSTQQVFGAMRDVNEALGTTVLIVTHDPSVADHVRRTVQIRDGRTSTEVLRSSRVGEGGDVEHTSEEFVVLDRVGRMQLPEEYIARLALRDRVRLGLADDHAEVYRADPGASGPVVEPPRSGESEPGTPDGFDSGAPRPAQPTESDGSAGTTPLVEPPRSGESEPETRAGFDSGAPRPARPTGSDRPEEER